MDLLDTICLKSCTDILLIELMRKPVETWDLTDKQRIQYTTDNNSGTEKVTYINGIRQHKFNKVRQTLKVNLQHRHDPLKIEDCI